MNDKGQAVASEYVMLFFVAIAALAAMAVYVQRGLQARIHDARDYMIDAVISSGACDSNCLMAAGGSIFYEYEPYYPQALSTVGQNAVDTTGDTTGSPLVIGAKYINAVNDTTTRTSITNQLPPECADNVAVKPSWCSTFVLP